LVSALIWALLFGLIYFVFKKNIYYSFLLGIVVFSHWILDLISHLPDLPLIPGSSIKIGLGLWNSVSLTVIIESFIFLIGVYLYFTTTKSRNKRGYITLWILLILLSFTYVMDIIGPPPPSVTAIAMSGLSQLLIAAWGYWIDRNREDIIK